MIYISYNWANKNFCTKFFVELSKSTEIHIWVDYKKADWLYDMWDHIAPAIENATLIIVILTNSYCDSKVNFRELSYAVQRPEAHFESKREWMRNLSKDQNTVSYNAEMHDMVNEVLEHELFQKQINALNTYSSDITPQLRICTIM